MNRTISRITATLLLVTMVLVVAACGSSSPPAPTTGTPSGGNAADDSGGEEFYWRFALSATSGSFQADYALKVGEEITSRTNGKLKVDVFTDGVLGSDRESAENIQNGTIQLTLVTFAILANFAPEVGAADLPYIISNWETAEKFLVSDVIDVQAEALLDKGFYSIGPYCFGFRQCTNNVRPIYTLDDFAGIKFRVQENDVFIATFRALGAYPVPMAQGEVITAMQTNTIDGQENPMFINYILGLPEFQKYLSATSHVCAVSNFVANPAALAELPEEYRQIVLDVVHENRLALTQSAKESEADYTQLLIDGGMEYNEVTPENIEIFRQVCMEEVWPQFADQYGEMIDIIAALG